MPMHMVQRRKGSGEFWPLALVVVFLLPLLAAAIGPLLPIGDGTYSEWSTSSSSPHFVLVDEAACNGNADYVYTSTIGQRDSYDIDLSGIPDGQLITSIAIQPCASKRLALNKTATSSLDVFYRFNGVNSADQGDYSLTGTTPFDLATTTFSGLWLPKTATSTLEIGAVLAGGTAGAKVSRIAAFITATSTFGFAD